MIKRGQLFEGLGFNIQQVYQLLCIGKMFCKIDQLTVVRPSALPGRNHAVTVYTDGSCFPKPNVQYILSPRRSYYHGPGSCRPAICRWRESRGFIRWLRSQYHSQRDKIKNCTCGKSSLAGGAPGTKGRSCCCYSELATASKSSEMKSCGEAKETPLIAHFSSKREIRSGDLIPGTCSRFHRS
jgi:hypothetical protein